MFQYLNNLKLINSIEQLHKNYSVINLALS